jgi:hypothetical protein
LPSSPLPELGIIEGYYGAPWSWDARRETARFLADHGYRFYLYAPKADLRLRRRWSEPHPDTERDELAALARTCEAAGVRFGIGLSPFEIYERFDRAAQDALDRKLREIDEIGARELAILFDDMRGDTPNLAERQVDIVHWAAGRSGAERLTVCPTYYSDDPVLDRVFGARPDRYLEDLGARLDERIGVFWTGEEVCSREIGPGHLRRVGEQLRRPPVLWDNYPVNDGQRMSQYLHVRGFTGRPASIAPLVTAHGINPALQPTLSRIPALTLADAYREGDAYQYSNAARRAAIAVLGPELGRMLHEDTLTLQDVGLDRLGPKAEALRARYGSFEHPGAREILAWLDGAYRITDDIVATQ